MTDLLKTIQDLNLDPQKLQQLVTTAKDNPFAAMGMVQELGIAPEALQKVMSAVMANPGTLLELAKQFGVNDDLIASMKQHVPGADKLPL